MKNLFRTGLAAMALLTVAGPLAAQGAPEIVWVNSQRIMQEAPVIQQAREQMQQEMQRLEQQIAPLRNEYQQLVEQFQQQQGMMSAETRRERQQALAQKQQEIQQTGAQLEQQAAGKQEELLAPALDRVNTVIEQIRAERGYRFILDVGAGGVLAADPALDITEDVLQRLQAVANTGS